MSAVANEFGEVLQLQGLPSTGVKHKRKMLQAIRDNPEYKKLRGERKGISLSLDNVGTRGDREALESSAIVMYQNALEVEHVLQDIFHVFNRITETLRNSHKQYALALSKLRKVSAAGEMQVPLCSCWPLVGLPTCMPCPAPLALLFSCPALLCLTCSAALPCEHALAALLTLTVPSQLPPSSPTACRSVHGLARFSS